MDTLFDLDEPSPFDRERLAASLAELAGGGVYIGGSSWKYEGWIGQIYRRSNYLARGKYSRRQFEETCIREYASIFPTVCGDFAFYQFPTQEFWRRLFSQVPEGFRFSFKAPEQITCKMFPEHARYGSRGGTENESFLDAAMLREMFLRPLEPHREKIAALIFEFGAFGRSTFASAGEFAARLDPFLQSLPGEFRYGVEIRNREFLARPYFDCLRAHGVAHVYNAWSRMPELQEQLAIPESRTADFTVCRALLRQGRVYERAVREFEPYTEIRDPNPAARQAMRRLIDQARAERQAAYVYVNNRLEGNSPMTIEAVLGLP